MFKYIKTMKEKYIFLDRDGVINKDPGDSTIHGYVTCWDEFIFLPKVFCALKKLTESGFKIIIISNQQGVGKSLYTKDELKIITNNMTKAIKEKGSDVLDVFYCMHLKEDNCKCRKPEKGLFLMAKEKYNIENFENYFYIADTEKDIQAGKRIGLKTILVLTGKTKEYMVKQFKYKPDYICKNLLDSVELILKKNIYE